MNRHLRSALTLGVQIALLVLVAANYQFDRSTDPHVLIKVRPVDPDSPVKGRYLTLQVETVAPPSKLPLGAPLQVSLSAEQGRLIATPAPATGQFASQESCGMQACWVLRQPLEFYVPEHASLPDRSVSLWVDATLPRKGPPRPVRLMQEHPNGPFTALDFN